jgi:pimeloyl-ACP methyl ester carboxylesterase
MKTRIILIIILVLVLIYALGPKPATPDYAVEFPAISGELSSVAQFVADHENRSDIKPDNEARIFWANDTLPQKTDFVLLYLHGFSASRKEGEPVYQNVAKRYGMNTYAARLATQGLDTVDQMIDYRPERLWESAKLALAIAEQLGDKVIVMSTSTGGTLGLKLAATYPDKVHALVNLSPNIRIKDAGAWVLNKPWGLQIARLFYGGDYRHYNPPDSNYRKYWYKDYRVESLVYLQQLVESTMQTETFQEVTCPVLSVYYFKNQQENDDQVKVSSIRWMHENLATADSAKRAVAIPNAQTHIIGCGFYSKAIPEVEAAIFAFAEEVIQLEPLTLQH